MIQGAGVWYDCFRLGLSDVKLRQLEAMRAVMANGTTTDAAKVMGLTQSAVSRLICQLEKELGLSLFDRRHGRLLISPEGQHVFDVAVRVLEGIDQMTATAHDIRTFQSGALRIIAMPALAYGLLPDTIAGIKQRYKQVKISVDLGGRRELEDGIAAGRYDFALATLPVNEDGVDIEPLCAMDAVCVAPPGHPIADSSVINAEQLGGMPFISIDQSTLLRFITDELFGKLGVRRVLGINAQSTMLACNLVARGLGFAVVHPFIAETFGDRIVTRPFRPKIRLEYGLMLTSGQRRSLIAQDFMDSLRQNLAGSAEHCRSE